MKVKWHRGLGVLVLAAMMVTLAGSASAAGRPPVTLPEQAKWVAPGVYYLGTAIDRDRLVEGYAFVRYKKAFGKPGTECGNGICEPGENANKCPQDCGGGEEPDGSSCYSFLARGARWRAVEPYLVDPTNDWDLSPTFVRGNVATDIAKWERSAGMDILGDETSGTVDGADTESPDGKNELYFGEIAEEGAIAMTIVWGVFRAPPSARQLVEWDQVYDQVDFGWSDSGETGRMDFENIATHELGHSVGMGDLYTTDCSEQTMYGYASEGETKKRTLEAGDIAGVRELYQ
ncbi:MAG: matrixin family metalloprotease [Anaerolineae bacterium]|nr:matrixin family metalloprotease [Anaerolineae bacterium]